MDTICNFMNQPFYLTISQPQFIDTTNKCNGTKPSNEKTRLTS